VFSAKSGYTGVDMGRYRQPGSNGLTFDPDGRLTVCQHGNRRVIRVEQHGNVTVLADRYDDRRLNSPHDLVYRSDGTLYFTDPPTGLPGTFEYGAGELPFSGVFCVPRGGGVELVADDLSDPGGLAFSPDELHLYIANAEPDAKVIKRYDVRDDGSLSSGTVFYDLTDARGEAALDGLKVDREGNVYACGPGGIWILSPDAIHLGTLVLPEELHNLVWGGDDGRTLYVTARTGVYRIGLLIPGIRPEWGRRLQ
jgi:gluconolactonase